MYDIQYNRLFLVLHPWARALYVSWLSRNCLRSCLLLYHRVNCEQLMRLGGEDKHQGHESQSGAASGALRNRAETFACSSGEDWRHCEGRSRSGRFKSKSLGEVCSHCEGRSRLGRFKSKSFGEGCSQ